MKRTISIFLSFVLIAVFITNSLVQAATQSVTSPATLNSLKSLTCTKSIGQDVLSVNLASYKGYKVSVIDSPNRIVIDIPNTKASNAEKKITVNSKRIKTVRYAQFDNNICRIVVDIIGQPQCFAEEKKGKLVLYIVNTISKNLDYYFDEGDANIVLNGVNLLKATTAAKKLYTEKYTLSSKRYTLTFASSLATLENKTVKVNDALVSSVQTSRNKITKLTSIIINTKVKAKCSILTKAGLSGSIIRVSGGVTVKPVATTKPTPTKKVTPTPTKKVIPTPTKKVIPTPTTKSVTPTKKPTSRPTVAPTKLATPRPTVAPTKLATPKPTIVPPTPDPLHPTPLPTPLPPLTVMTYISYSLIGGVDAVSICLVDYKGYSISRLTDSDRIVIDIPNVTVTEKVGTINVNSSLLKAVRYSQYDERTARIVLDTVGMIEYSVTETEGVLIIKAVKSLYKGISYHNSGDRVYFNLPKVVLTTTSEVPTKYFTAKYDSTGLKYTITFSTSRASIGSGIMTINDARLNNIKITNNTTTKKTSITIDAKDKFIYEIIYRDNTNDTNIDILKPFTKEDRMIVIDPGHGGVDPGAVSGGVKEKDLNLDISLRLNALLKQQNIKTYIMREDDSFVGLYERTDIANQLNATLFLCIHNNANDATSYGTETLYMPDTTNGFGSMRFAQIMQEELVNALGSYDRGLWSRPGLAVLRTTKMPAALAEVGFIDNKTERSKLITNAYKQKAAQALCDAVIRSLSEMNG